MAILFARVSSLKLLCTHITAAAGLRLDAISRAKKILKLS
jgi:hypothetical protein